VEDPYVRSFHQVWKGFGFLFSMKWFMYESGSDMTTLN
jgi:hypothetical protein